MHTLFKATISFFLMFAMLTQVFASGLSCVHHSSKHDHALTEHNLIMSHSAEVMEPSEELTSANHCHHHQSLNQQIHPYSAVASHHLSDCHSDTTVMQMNPDDCHCTTFVAFELMPLSPLIETVNESVITSTRFYKSKPVLGYLNSIYRPPLAA